MPHNYRVGIDIGGTFTDLVIFNTKEGRISLVKKVLTTPTNPSRSVIKAISEISNKVLEELEFIIHATTIATNALLGQLGLELPKTALITTKGFRDVIEIGRQRRPELYNFFVQRPSILIPRRYRFEIDERLRFDGEVIKPLNRDELLRIIEEIAKEGFESVAISLLHSYANPVHEKIIEEELRKAIKDIFISASYRVNPEHREFERTSTTVVNAVLMPIVSRYLRNLVSNLRKLVRAEIYIMQSNGGIESVSRASELPVSIIESGPASGVMATKYILDNLGFKNAMSFDMGGTTAKAGTIINGSPLITTEYEVGGKVHVGRVVKGSGYPVRFPFIDLAEISAGGGSIIWVDESGALKVGPISAGADPGPACYGKGGVSPTITDAHLILGRLNGSYLLGGDLRVYFNLAEEAFKEKITKINGLDPVEAAIGGLKIANSLMSKIMRIVTVERGIDPKDLVLVAFGGAGPMHACSLAREIGIRKIIIPESPGLFSAIGLLVVDFKHTLIRSIRKTLDEVSFDELNNIFTELENRGVKLLISEGVNKGDIIIKRYFDTRYLGQGYELIISGDGLTHGNYLDEIRERFHSAHRNRYGYALIDEPIEIVNARVDVLGMISKPKLTRLRKREYASIEPIEHREAYFESTDEFQLVPIYSRDKLWPGFKADGPLIIEQYDSTIIVEDGWGLEIDDYGNIILTSV